MSRRKDPKGTVLKEHENYRSDGRYEYKYRDKTGRRHSLYSRTLKELREKEEKLLKNVYSGLSIDAQKLTLNDQYDKWIKLKVNLKDNVKENYKYMYEAFVREEIGKLKLVDINNSDIRSFYLRLLDQRHMKARTLEVIQTVLYPVFKMAMDENIIAKNPAEKALSEIKRSEKYKSEKKKALTLEQQKAFENYINSDPRNQQWQIFIFMLYTGLRVGEATGLTKDDIDDEEVKVNHTLVYYDKRPKNGMVFAINSPKTEAGKREVTLLPQAKEALEKNRKFLEEAEIKCRAVVDGYTDFIFVNRFGDNLHQGTLNKALRRIVRDYNLEEIDKATKEKREPVLLPKISTHILRHTFATRMVENDVNIKVMQDELGHKDIHTTLDIYTDAQKELKKKEMVKMAKI